MTKIDTLVIELGLDTSKMNKQQQSAIRDLRRFEQGAEQGGRRVESSLDRTMASVSGLKKGIIGIFAGLTGNAIISFVNNMTAADRAVAQTARVTNISTKELSAWQTAVRQSGGTAEDASSAISGLASDINAFRTNTGGGAFLPLLNRLGVAWRTWNGEMRSTDDILLDVNKRIQDMVRHDPGMARSMLMTLPGMNEGMVQLLIRSPQALQRYLEKAREAGTTTDDAAAAAERYQEALTELSTSAYNLGRVFTTLVAGPLATFMNWWTDWLQVVAKSPLKTDTSTPAGARQVARGREMAHWVDEMLRAGLGGTGGVFGPLADAFGTGGTGNAPATAGAAPAIKLRVKAGAGIENTHPGTQALARSLQSDIPGINRFTAGNDKFHQGRPSAHSRGLAIDFTVNDPKQAGEIADQIRAKMKSMGIAATVLDEYSRPSPFSTGGHIHVQFADQMQAARFQAMTMGGGGGNISTSSTVTVQQMIINAHEATAKGIARDMKGEMQQQFGQQANVVGSN